MPIVHPTVNSFDSLIRVPIHVELCMIHFEIELDFLLLLIFCFEKFYNNKTIVDY